MNKICGVYKIVNPVGQVYIGASTDIHKRFNNHKSGNSKNNRKLYQSFNTYGVDNHDFEILETCENEELNNKESFYGQKYKVLDDNKGLNLAIPKDADGNGGYSKSANMNGGKWGFKKGHKTWNKGIPCKESTKALISMGKKGQPSKLKGTKTFKIAANSKIVLCLETGIYFDSILKASEAFNIKRTTLQAMLSGVNKNRTNLKLC